MQSARAGPIERGVNDTRFHHLPDGRSVAFRHTRGEGPALVFLPGYMSDMAGGKANALWSHAVAKGRECLLLDYSGCGESDGDFAAGTLSRWRDEVISLVEGEVAGDVVLVGSSMGGWLMLLVAEALDRRVAGLVGIAAAPDFTEWGYSDAQKRRLAAGETVLEDNAYGPRPTPTYPQFWGDGQTMRRLDGPIAFDGPVRLLHGQNDADVPSETSLRLAAALRSSDVQVTLVKGGDHRLSREQDIALLLHTVDSIVRPR